MTNLSRNALDGKVHIIQPGLAIYRVKASRYWRVRIWNPAQKKRIVRSTKETVKADAIKEALAVLAKLTSGGALSSAAKNRTFEYFADRLVKKEKAAGLLNQIYSRQGTNTHNLLNHPQWGAVQYFSGWDVGKIQTTDYLAYTAYVRGKDPGLSSGTMNHIAVAFRKVLKLAHNEGAIVAVPPTPRVRRNPKPRAFFQFDPLVTKANDEYKRLLKEARAMALANVKVRGAIVTDELRDLILFLVHSFLRPTQSEVFSLRHVFISPQTNPKSLLITIPKGKTGNRISTTMEAAVSVYDRIKKRNPSFGPNDYLFLPKVQNRAQAQKIFQRQFGELLKRCGLTISHVQTPHSLYSLRHTAICMRLVLSQGAVNLLNLATNAGTSVDQIERFYAKYLPPTPALARNLQSLPQRIGKPKKAKTSGKSP